MPDQNFSLDALLHRVLPLARDDHLRDCIGPLTLQSNGLKVPQVTRMLAAYIASTNSTAWLETYTTYRATILWQQPTYPATILWQQPSFGFSGLN